MKRYLLFAGDHYYPSGGMDDFIKDFDTQNEAMVEAHIIAGDSFRWWHIWDSEMREIVEHAG